MRPAFPLTREGTQEISVPCGRQTNNGGASSLAGELVEHLKLLLQSAISPGSRRTYQRAWTVYIRQIRRTNWPVRKFIPSVKCQLSCLVHSTLVNKTTSTGDYFYIHFSHKLKGYADLTKVFLSLNCYPPLSLTLALIYGFLSLYQFSVFLWML